MKTIVAISDTHGNNQSIGELFGLFSECNYIVHLGDGARDMKNFMPILAIKYIKLTVIVTLEVLA